MRVPRLAENSAVLMALFDGSDRLRWANRAFRTTFFLERGETPLWSELMRRNFHAGRGTVIQTEDFEAWLHSTISRRGKVPFRAFETDVVDGRWLWMTETVDAEGWMLCVASDVTSMKADERSVRQDRDFALKAAQTDDLTGLANRRFTLARANDMLQGSVQGKVVGSFAILDLDRFKSINDRFGHHIGDAILKDFTTKTQELVRRGDCLGRVGGEEFALVVPGAPLEVARQILIRMLERIRESAPLPDVPDFRYTFSAGLTEALGGEDLTNVYERADRALYLAKVGGRDRIETYGNRPA
ncbi:sensor domain-containing diguanylate cyclase [Amorphus orientalis]|uniref:diguanylate cyclase n=1 Tax=Amorphus orientalis TaxID=649198 RepID=A0AAE3VRK6_9HYPH|nr:GGDEF domain-containing protein [Amorphus orientalis]MDQ0317059.1 diguanylate cyclase (GGDEF)-like protein [Amorphus orientalis]